MLTAITQHVVAFVNYLRPHVVICIISYLP